MASINVSFILIIFRSSGVTGSREYQDPQDKSFSRPYFMRRAGMTDKWVAHISNRIRQTWLLGTPSLVMAVPGFAGRGDHTCKYQAIVKLPCADTVKVCRWELARKTLS